MARLEIKEGDVRAALSQLDQSLAKRQNFIDQRQAQIDVMVDSLSVEPQSLDLILQIAQAYTAFNNDSALHYLSRGQALAEGPARYPFTLRKAALLPLGGSLRQAIDEYESVDTLDLPSSLRPLYYEAARQMYSYIASSPSVDEKSREESRRREHESQRRLIRVLPEDGIDYKYNLGEYYYTSGENGRARALLEHVMVSEPTSSNLRARAAHHLASLANEEHDNDAYLYYLTQSAIADASSATREVTALQELGHQLFSMGNVDRSYDYLSQALANAVECGASLRIIESSRSLPLIERAKAAQLERKERTITIIIAFLVLILLGLAGSLMMLRLEIGKMRSLQQRLRDANRTKDVYISQFLNLCSIYMDKLTQFCNIANRKISTGKVDDLYRLTKSGKFVEEQSKDFYEVFDNAFLHLYPDFPKQVNALLREDAQIALNEGERLNTDLRILAFMRLGIAESSRIAQVLNYSVNTIYAYRNRTKARAIDRDKFETQIMQINSIF